MQTSETSGFRSTMPRTSSELLTDPRIAVVRGLTVLLASTELSFARGGKVTARGAHRRGVVFVRSWT
jgi:hypothetical protein